MAGVHERLAADLAYTTVLSVLQTLDQKGAVRHEREGKAYRWYRWCRGSRRGGAR